MGDILLLGSNGALGRSVANALKEAGISFKTVTRDEGLAGDDCFFWDYRQKLPESISNASCVINCARGPSFEDNVRAFKVLLTGLRPSAKLIALGSNCIFAKPRSKLAKIGFQGDAYIVEKSLIDQLAARRENTILLRPTVVLDEGGWDDVQKMAKAAPLVIAPPALDGSTIKVISSKEVSKIIVEAVKGNLCSNIPNELYSNEIRASELFQDCQIAFGGTENTYFDNPIKNILSIFLCSRLVPFRVKSYLQLRLTRENQPNNQVQVPYTIQGMARLYLCGAHTKK